MQQKYSLLPALALSTALVLPVSVQADDRGYLTAFLEDNLSDAGRKVTITGFAGALSSRATIQQLTIADDEGIWITLDDIVLDWSRTALLSGEVIVNELSASQIVIERLPPGAEEEGLTPEAKAFEFSLPELPVSIDIGKINAEKIRLGASVLGQPVEGSLDAKMHLADGNGTAEIMIERHDAGPEGKIGLAASYANETGQLVIDLDAREGANGLVANALDLPGKPAAGLALKGEGTVDDFTATFRLESDGAERLAGPITVARKEDGARAFTARLAGNPAPLFLPEYAEFLGDDLKLDVAGESPAAGGLDLSALALQARSLNLSGKLAVAPDGLPSLIDLSAAILSPDGSPVLLPISGPAETRIDSGTLSLKFDAAQGSAWQADLQVNGLQRPDLTLRKAGMVGAGTIDRTDGKRGVDGSLNFDFTGIAGLDAALQRALGADVTGKAVFDWREGDRALTLPDLTLAGADYGLSGSAKINGPDQSLKTDLDLDLTTADLSRFSDHAGQPLAGAAEAKIKGFLNPLSGGFDLALDLEGQGLRAGIPEVDSLLKGQSTVAASVLRDETGTKLRDFKAEAASLSVTGQGTLASEGSHLTGAVSFANLGDLGGKYGGSLDVQGSFDGSAGDAKASVTGTGQNLRIGQPEVDRLLTGTSDLSAAIALLDGVPLLRDLKLTAPNLSAEVIGEGDQGAMRVAGRLRDLGIVLPDFPGQVTLSGLLTPQGKDYQADLNVQGPAGINAQIKGLLGAVPNLAIAGRGEAALLNVFVDPVTVAGGLTYDLRMQGGWALANLSGRASLNSGRVALPARGIGLEAVAANVDLGNGNARVDVTANPSRGGRLSLSGSVGLAAPFNGDLRMNLARAKLRDAELYDTTLDADLTLNGPLLGAARLAGVVTLDETELRVPSTGFASAADYEKFRHTNDSAAVRATRAKAGVEGAPKGSGSAASGSGLNWLLDVVIRAPNRVFVRGRGLDAELGGEIRLGGSMNAIVPTGALELVRGRLNILGKRLDLSEATLMMQGDFNPMITFVATNESDEVTSIVSITGPANDPEVIFSSDPELPQEEVLAWLLFGRGLDQISAFQAAQLANAVANLAGKGGEGIMSKLRRGFGFDDLDVNTSPEGSTSVKAGKYISDNVYSEIGVDDTGNTRINLNLDVRPGVTVKGRVDSDGSSGIGLFLEKDY